MNYITKRFTTFVNVKTGKLLGSVNAYLDVLNDPTDYQLAHDMATRLGSALIIVMATCVFEDGRTMQVTATFKLGQDEEEENEEEEEDKEEEENEEDEEESENEKGEEEVDE